MYIACIEYFKSPQLWHTHNLLLSKSISDFLLSMMKPSTDHENLRVERNMKHNNLTTKGHIVIIGNSCSTGWAHKKPITTNPSVTNFPHSSKGTMNLGKSSEYFLSNVKNMVAYGKEQRSSGSRHFWDAVKNWFVQLQHISMDCSSHHHDDHHHHHHHHHHLKNPWNFLIRHRKFGLFFFWGGS